MRYLQLARGGQVYCPNNPPKLTVSSRCIEKKTSGQSGTGRWVSIGNIGLVANEVVTGVCACGPNSSAYNNAAVWYMCQWKWSGSDFQIYIERGANDHSPIVTVVITVTKIIIS